MEHPNAHLSQHATEEQTREPFVPEWEELTPSSQEETDRYFGQLRSYFLYGEKSSEGLIQTLYPLRFAAQLRRDDPESEAVLASTGQTALQILNGQTQLNRALRRDFLTRLKRVTSGLNELLLLQSEESSSSISPLDFAEDLIAFDQIKDIATTKVSSHFPPARIERLRSALQTLTAAQESFAQRSLTIYTSEVIAQSFALDRIFDHAEIKVNTGTTCEQARKQSHQDIQEWVQLIKALRMGELLIQQQYDEQLHDTYFDRFDLSFLSQEEWKFLPPILVIEESRQILRQANDFLALLTDEGFVKVLGINWLEDLFRPAEQESSKYLELASLAICRRNGYIFQGGIELPTLLDEAYRKGLAFPGPVFWNILLPGPEMEKDGTAYHALLAATESRYFPRLEYETSDNHFVNRQIKLQHNPCPAATFTTYEQAIQTAGAIEPQVFPFTLADFLAMQAAQRETLTIISSHFQHAKLVTVADYVSLSQDDLADHIPFIWLVDEHHKLQRVLIPLNWVQACRHRLEYWDFLQSLAGTHPNQRQATTEELQSEWEQAKSIELDRLKTALEKQFAKDRSTDLQTAVYRMLNGLLSQEKNLESVLMDMSQEEAPPVVQTSPQTAPSAAEPAKEPKVEEAPQAKPQAIIKEAWVESDECTSCQDCIDALPAVFKYDENKQAYVHNPKGGTFAKIVSAAEKCPAACIHPGVPWNKEEADLEKWVKRAEKFN